MSEKNEADRDAVAGQVERPVRPQWEHEFESRLWNRAADAPRLTRQQCSEIGKEADAEIRRLQDLLFERGEMAESLPCFCCGYNGPGYYQPDTHPCAARHHALFAAERLN